MLRLRIFASMFPLAMTVMDAGVAQDYPSKPLRIVTSSAGSSSDITARVVAQGLSGQLGQPVIVDNRGSGLYQAEVTSRAVPDGYTLMIAGGTFLTWPLMQKNPPYDPVRDFEPITLVETAISVVTVHPSVPVKSIKELIAYAKAKPGALNYGASGIGGSSHMATELFKSMAGVDMVYVPYKGSGAATNALLAGEVQVGIFDPVQVLAHAKAGKLRVLASTGAQPSELAPGLPTVAASGLPGYEAYGITGLFAPAKTPAAFIDILNQAAVRFLRTPEAKNTFLKMGVEVVGNSPQQFAAAMKAEMDRKSKLIKEIGLGDK
jgi:tripartite-type tricarboxylate transporter receptor subunit TctC